MTKYSQVEMYEMAEALGFSSIVEMQSHQLWLDQQAAHKTKVKELTEKSKYSHLIDLRSL